uniref:Gustatory receptor n=1 Tax=Tetranychus urticae TaxID=32264 RepID=T1KKR0_TETUR
MLFNSKASSLFTLISKKEVMAISEKSVSIKIRDYFLKFKQILSDSIAIPDSHEFDAKVRDLVRRTERLTIIFQVVRNGLNQTDIPNVNKFGYRRLNSVDWIIALTSLANLLRIFVLFHNADEPIAFYLGDPLFRSKDRLPCLALCAMVIVIMLPAREWVLYLEAKGKLKVLSIWKDYRDGANLDKLCMNKLKIRRFRFSIYLLSLIFCYVMIIVPIFMTIVFFTPLLTNPWTYKIPRLAFYGTIWTVPLVITITYLVNSLFGFGWFILCTYEFHLFRLLDTLDRAGILLNKTNVIIHNEKDVRTFCLLIIRRLNSFELASRKLRYVLLYNVFVYSLLGDVYIFLGVIIRIYNDILANMLAILGIYILCLIGISGLILGNLITKLDNLTIRMHQLTIMRKFSVNTMSKALEVMDRVAGPYNGVKVGDFLTVDKTFFILFILENISTLMLITVNVRPLI